ncbi:MAG: UBA/ThiF-type binding fold containing protein [Acidimicrobiales bacterium]|nr:UBA/ThiF-type binding fold containing protein [Acidimicrobiales bacterium]
MSWGTPDEIDRTAKILIDANRATDPADARRVLEGLILQVAVGPEIATDPAAQAALATVVNAGRRAFKGGVHVTLTVDPILTTGWVEGRNASAVVTDYGGTIVDTLSDTHPTLVIGTPTIDAVGAPLLHLTWNGWSPGLVQHGDDRIGASGIAPAGVLAAGLGISECFQQELGAVVPGRRDIGLSLWRPDLDWRSADAAGPALEYLPAAVWLLGLGHLGQAYAWTLGTLPYAVPAECHIALMDFDLVVAGNTATQLLVTDSDLGRRKTRVVADVLEGLGIRTRVVERAFDEHLHPVPHADSRRDEPLVALAGFDDPGPRRLLGGAGFERIVDAGVGAGPVEYLDMVLHTFPGPDDPSAAFPDGPPRQHALGDAYEAEIARQTAGGANEAAARCGMLDLAGVTVGAAFVGTIASTLAVGDVLRVLHEGAEYSVIALDLRNPGAPKAVLNTAAGDYIPTATAARPPA